MNWKKTKIIHLKNVILDCCHCFCCRYVFYSRKSL